MRVVSSYCKKDEVSLVTDPDGNDGKLATGHFLTVENNVVKLLTSSTSVRNARLFFM